MVNFDTFWRSQIESDKLRDISCKFLKYLLSRPIKLHRILWTWFWESDRVGSDFVGIERTSSDFDGAHFSYGRVIYLIKNSDDGLCRLWPSLTVYSLRPIAGHKVRTFYFSNIVWWSPRRLRGTRSCPWHLPIVSNCYLLMLFNIGLLLWKIYCHS